MAFQLKVESNEVENLLKLIPIGELDIYHTPDFKDKAVSAYYKNKEDILVDGSELEYLDSTGLGGFIYLLNIVQKDGKKIKMQNIKPNIKKLFTITKLDELFVFEGGNNE